MMARHPKPLAGGAFLVLGMIGSLLAPPDAVAQAASEDAEVLAEARRIFSEGLSHSDRHEWHEAVAAFRQVIELRAAPPVLYNLAVALAEIGEYPEAQDLLGRVFADDSTTPPIRAASEDLLRELEARGGKIDVDYRGAREGVVFFVDGFALAGEALDRAHLASPGAHTVSVRRGATVLARAEVSVEQGETKRVELVSPDAAPRRHTAGLEEPSAAPQERSLAKNPWLWTGVGLGVGAAVAIVLAVTLGGGDTADPFEGDFTPGRITW